MTYVKKKVDPLGKPFARRVGIELGLLMSCCKVWKIEAEMVMIKKLCYFS